MYHNFFEDHLIINPIGAFGLIIDVFDNFGLFPVLFARFLNLYIFGKLRLPPFQPYQNFSDPMSLKVVRGQIQPIQTLKISPMYDMFSEMLE